MQILTLGVAAPPKYEVPPTLQALIPHDVPVDKVRAALKSKLPTLKATPFDCELLVFTLSGNDRPPAPSFIEPHTIQAGPDSILLDSLSYAIESDGSTLRFKTYDGKSHELPFQGAVSDFLDLLGWCRNGARYVICATANGESPYPHYVVEVNWITPFTRGDRPSSPQIERGNNEGDSSTST